MPDLPAESHEEAVEQRQYVSVGTCTELQVFLLAKLVSEPLQSTNHFAIGSVFHRQSISFDFKFIACVCVNDENGVDLGWPRSLVVSSWV